MPDMTMFPDAVVFNRERLYRLAQLFVAFHESCKDITSRLEEAFAAGLHSQEALDNLTQLHKQMTEIAARLPEAFRSVGFDITEGPTPSTDEPESA